MEFRTWLLARLRERSTWMGIVGAVSAAGVAVSPDQQEAIVSAGVAVVAAIAAMTRDDPNGD